MKPATLLLLDLALPDAAALVLPRDGAGAPPRVVALPAEPPPDWAALAADGPASLVAAPSPLVPAALDAGIAGWWPPAVLADAAVLATALAADAHRWQAHQALRRTNEALRGQLDERKWIERAKGLMMAARDLPEDEAFVLLRTAAMHANLKLGELSRSLVEASRWADAVNRAGALRMLSQRLVKLAAQRLVGIDPAGARAALDDAARRVQDNLDALASFVAASAQPLAPQVDAALAEWRALQAVLARRANAALLADADARAERLLAQADTLTAALESLGARRALRLVNLCGRQRMRVQRLAKTALLGAAGVASNAADAASDAALAEVEATLADLERAPLTGDEIRALLARARDEWLRLVRALRQPPAPASLAALAQAADTLLDVFDALTAQYERSLQGLME
jgi:hypothetical protein